MFLNRKFTNLRHGPSPPHSACTVYSCYQFFRLSCCASVESSLIRP